MDFWLSLIDQSLSWGVLLYAFLGTLAGIIAAAIPGFTILMAVVLVFPFTFSMTPLEGLSTLIGVYVGGYSGGQISGILLGIPGTPSSICTVFDGYPMAKAGRAGEALGIGIFASFFGGILGGIAMVLFIKPVAEFGLKFGPWEIFGLVLFSLTLIATLGGKSFSKGMVSGFLGLLMAMVGTDNTAGLVRFTFGFDELIAGFSLLPVLVGLFAMPSLLDGLKTASGEKKAVAGEHERLSIPYRTVFKDLKNNWVNLLRSSFFGAFVGALPGEGGSVANFLAYDQAKRYSKTPEKFGTGCPDGVVASESGNNACAGGSLIPTLALGIPGSAADAVLLGVLMVHSIPPGPALFKESAMLVYGLFVVFFIAHFYMLALQLGIGSKVFLRITQCPQWAMVPVVLLMCAIGCFALNNQTFDIWLFFFLGIVGVILQKAGFPLAPVVIGLLLGGMCEDNLRQAFSISTDWTLFFTRPISGFFVVMTLLSILYCGVQFYKERKLGKVRAPIGQIRLSIAVSVAVIALSVIFFITSTQLPGATRWDAIGSRLIPQIVIVCLGAFAVICFGSQVIAHSHHPDRLAPVSLPKSVPGLPSNTEIFILMAAWIWLISIIGFYPSSLLFLYALMFAIRRKISTALIVLPPATLAVVWAVFSLFLKVQLPRGLFY